MTAHLHARLVILDHDTPFAILAREIELAGFIRHPFPEGYDRDPPMAIWADDGRTLVYARDGKSGLQTLASPDGLPETLLDRLPVMPADRAADLLAVLPFLSGDRSGQLHALRQLPIAIRFVPKAFAGILASALTDADWEIRATAMLTAARLGAADLAPAIARIDFPEDPALGIGRHENRILLALRDAALAMLGQPRGKALPDGLIDAIEGEETALPADVGAFVHSLVAPLPRDIAQPPPTAGVELTPQGPQTTDGRLLAWVPPSAYWLGHRAQPRGEPNPARRIALTQGFYIEAEAREPATLAEACAAAAAQARNLARSAHLATSEEWEMAARGSDGRRYPWGQNADPALRVDLSPCGMADIIGGPGEWLSDAAPEGRGVTTSGARSSLLSARASAAAGDRKAFRLVYPI